VPPAKIKNAAPNNVAPQHRQEAIDFNCTMYLMQRCWLRQSGSAPARRRGARLDLVSEYMTLPHSCRDDAAVCPHGSRNSDIR
jgi:hypothetical protein